MDFEAKWEAQTYQKHILTNSVAEIWNSAVISGHILRNPLTGIWNSTVISGHILRNPFSGIWNSAVISKHILRNHTQGYRILLFCLCPSLVVVVLDVDSQVELRAQV
jgi:hypothetical protein